MPVICVDFEPALRWSKPAVGDAKHGKSALAQPERERFRFTAIAGTALHSNRHGFTIPLKLVEFPGAEYSGAIDEDTYAQRCAHDV
jgi:hypothetical protein